MGYAKDWRSQIAAAFLVSLGAAGLGAQGTPSAAQAPAPKAQAPAPKAQAAKPSAPLPKLAEPLDGGWPREVKTTAGVVTVYQPQIDAWDGSRVALYAAVSLKEKEDAAPIYGVVWADGQTAVDTEARLVTMTNREFKKVTFPSHPEKNGPLLEVVRKEVAPVTRTLSLDRFVALLEVADADKAVRALQLDHTPPAFLEVEVPAGNGVGTARAIARAYAALAEGGAELGITPETFAHVNAIPVVTGRKDVVLGVPSYFSLGFLRPGPTVFFGSSPRAFGSPGAGGSFGCADPDAHLGYAYVMNRLDFYIENDPREKSLRDAVYRAIARLGARTGAPSMASPS